MHASFHGSSVIFRLLLLLSLSGVLIPAFSGDLTSVDLGDDTQLQLRIYPAEGESLLVILPSEHGITEGLTSMAGELSELGVETWIADPFETWFLPAESASLDEIPVTAYAKLIEHAQKTGKAVYLFSNDKGAGLLLRSAYEWQLVTEGIISGVILISPDMYTRTPSGGNEGEFLPIASVSNLPVFIYVPSKSTLALRINDTVDRLQEGGSDVYVQGLYDVRNRFFFRPDATRDEQLASRRLPGAIVQSMRLTRHFARQRVPVRKDDVTTGIKVEKMTGQILEYMGQFQPDELALKGLYGRTHTLSQYIGNVVVVNFWASWCPPCIHEMPSMSRLAEDLKDKPFEILAINLGEKEEDIRAFLNEHPVSFPVLLDPQQTLPRKWKVFAFPTSFLLDKKGIIRYAVAGGIDWSSRTSRDIIDHLLSLD